MSARVILLSIPGLRCEDLPAMPNLRAMAELGEQAVLAPSFPCVTCPVQANMTTGRTPREHGVIANGFYYRERHEFEMWTAWNDCIEAPQIWDILHRDRPGTTSAVWFPLHSKGCGADYICTPAPKHNPDGTESLWCYTRPENLYEELLPQLDHFPLQHFWGPLANIFSSQWIADSAIEAAKRYRPDFFYIYLPHLDYAAQKTGPDSEVAQISTGQLDEVIGKLRNEMSAAYGDPEPLWIVASEYTILPVDHVTYPNRLLREAGLLTVRDEADGEYLDFAASRAWAMTDHQLSHIFVEGRDANVIDKVVELFTGQEGIAEVLHGNRLTECHLDHANCGDVVLVSVPTSWQAYYYWLDEARAPGFARKVDIHNKPGYDPVEMHVDLVKWGIPLDATLVRGSHGAPAQSEAQRGPIISSRPGVLGGASLADTDVAGIVLRQFGL